ncbi:MAG: hypothetical protein LBS21_07135 [Clostridiales bacterium]|jgi:capsular polysaccharide biosynthesis protein|nr:hypothetical protein [Clostridiales bacterium]
MSGDEFTVDLSVLLRLLKKNAAVICICIVVGAVIAFVTAEFILEKKYSATAKFYIENSKAQSEIININDITAAKSMVDTCAELFSTRNIVQKLKDATGVTYEIDQMLEMISMGTSNNTEFLVITVTTDDAAVSVDMLTKFIDICLGEFETTIDSGRIRVVDSAYSSGEPVFPNNMLAVAIGIAAGFFISFFFFFLREMLDTKVKAEDDLFVIYNIPVFAEIMSFDAKQKGGYGYE